MPEHHMVKTASNCSLENSPRYISLRDILTTHDFDSPTISINNQLLKHAASAYLYSATILVAREESCLMRLWRVVLRQRVAVRSVWQDLIRRVRETCLNFARIVF